MTDLQFLALAVFLFAILFGFMVNLVWYRLCRDELKTDYSRVTLSVLNDYIKDSKYKQYLPQLTYCRKMHITYLAVLAIAVLFIVFVVIRGIR